MSAQPSPSRGERELLLRAVARLDADAVARGMTEALRADGRYGSLVREGDEALRVNRWNIELFLRWLREARAPDESDLRVLRTLARRRALEGMPAHELVRAYRDGVRYGWQALLEVAQEEERPALVGAADVFFQHVEVVSEAIGEAYAGAEADLGAGSAAERAARSLLAALLAGGELSAEDRGYAERIGLRTGGEMTAFALALEGGTVPQHAEAALRLRTRGALAVTEDARVAGVAAEPVGPALCGAGEAALAIESDPRPVAALEAELGAVRRQLAVAQAEGLKGYVGGRRYLLEVMAARSTEVAERIERQVFGVLDGERRGELAQTLEVLVEHDFDRGAAAAALPVHRNTMTYRLKRLQELTGLDLTASDDRLFAWVAVRRRAARRAQVRGLEALR